ncbi:putative PDDEXK_1 domain-containing protein [Gammaproteobacteria bacterium]
MTTTQKLYIPAFEPVGHLYHDAAGQILDSVTTILKAELGLYQYSSQGKANLGTYIHKACHYFDEGDLKEETLLDDARPYVEQYKRALSSENIKVLRNEVMRYHVKYMYAGSLDKIVVIGDKAGVLDIKTGKEESWHKWQTGAYAEMVKHEYKDSRPPFLGRWALYLAPDSYRLVEHNRKQDFREFLAFLAAHNLKVNNGYRNRKIQ